MYMFMSEVCFILTLLDEKQLKPHVSYGTCDWPVLMSVKRVYIVLVKARAYVIIMITDKAALNRV